MTKTVIITGATAGFGEACARLFARQGYRCIITGRRLNRLEKISKEISSLSPVKILCFDVRSRSETTNAIDSLPDEWKTIDVLVNNAGLASGFGPVDEGNPDDWDVMIDTNIKGLLYVSHAVIPLLKKQKSGHIINIGSIAGKETYKNGNVYCATKHAVDALSKAMRIDLLPWNIKVSSVCPGAAQTEFSLVRYKGNEQKARDVYKGFKPLTANDIAETVWFVASRPEHVNINDVVITPAAQANTVHLIRDEE